MRKLGAALLAVPALVAVHLASLPGRGATLRLLAGLTAAAVTAVIVIVSTPPTPSVAVPESTPEPVSADLFMTIGTSHALTAPFTIAFDAPMNRASVAGSLSVEPETSFTIGWDAALRVLTVTPRDHWRPDTLYRLTVGATARSDEGGELGRPLRTVVLTSRAGSGEMAATRAAGKRVRLDTAFAIRLDRPVPISAVRAALQTTPAVAGDVVAGEEPGAYLFTPSKPLKADTAYRLALDGLGDADGVPFAAAPAIAVRTIAAPEVVGFRPRAGTGRVDRGATLSVRFSVPMERERTASSITVNAGGRAVAGKVMWREDNRVLLFDPSRALPYDAYVTVTVGGRARSRTGAPIAKPVAETFRIEVKPKPKPTVAPGDVAIPSGGGGAVSGNWQAVERYYLRLMNCTRTGGWVTSRGSCSSPGGRNVAPLRLSAGISSKVARPYARLLATRNHCSHFIGGGPDDRLRRAGYTSYRWAENIGCRSGGARGAVLGSHLFFQAEKPYNGGHYRNLMNAAFDRVGIGVWVAAGRVRLVVDFYHP